MFLPRRLDPRITLLALVEFSHVIVIDGVKNAINGPRLFAGSGLRNPSAVNPDGDRSFRFRI
jgi:hypothetical protein